jgi:C1A family cysteine protease
MSDSADLSALLGAARDQGNRETCLAFATGAAHELARFSKRGGAVEPLGEELLYWRCKQIDLDDQGGTTPSSVAAALKDPGQSAATYWPYDGGRDECDPAYQPPQIAIEPENMRLATFAPTSLDLANIRALVRVGHVIVLGLDLWPSFYRPEHGEVAVPSSAELLGEAHAVAVVGFDDEAAWLLVRNSWGLTWGNQGHIRLPEAAVEVAGLGAWIVEDDIQS